LLRESFYNDVEHRDDDSQLSGGGLKFDANFMGCRTEISKMKKIYVGLLLALSCQAASALEVIVGHVISVEPSSMHGIVSFRMDAGSTSCPAGRWVYWQKADTSNNKIVYATLLQALATGKKIEFYVNDGDTGCFGQYLHLQSDA